MKKIVTVFFALFLAGSVFAQNKMEENKMNTMDKMSHKGQECVIMKEGKMMVMTDGKTMHMDKPITMKNGTMVMKDGTVKMKDGKTMMMKEGESMDMEGKMMKMKTMNKMSGKM
jgi:hypothetical protein